VGLDFGATEGKSKITASRTSLIPAWPKRLTQGRED
jgi:hypothetical protein